MTVVIDCNILIMCLTSRSPYHLIYQSFIKGGFELAMSIDIMLEYEEIIQQKYGLVTANMFIALLKELPNVHYVTPFYKWRLMETDPDDNKYCDCAIAGKASYLVTEDRHFVALKKVSFPKLNTIGIDDFMKIVIELQEF